MQTILRSLHPHGPLSKQYRNHILLIHLDYFNHLSAKYMYQVLLPIFHNYLTHIVSKSWPDFSHSNLGKTWNIYIIICLSYFPFTQLSMLSSYFFILLNSKFFAGVNHSKQNFKNYWWRNNSISCFELGSNVKIFGKWVFWSEAWKLEK